MLDYIALGILLFAAIVMFYGIIVVHDIPYEISVSRNHPHQDAIHYAGWISLFTLHVLWPFLWIWATLYREDRGWGFAQDGNPNDESQAPSSEIQELKEQLQAIEQRLSQLENPSVATGDID